MLELAQPAVPDFLVGSAGPDDVGEEIAGQMIAAGIAQAGGLELFVDPTRAVTLAVGGVTDDGERWGVVDIDDDLLLVSPLGTAYASVMRRLAPDRSVLDTVFDAVASAGGSVVRSVVGAVGFVVDNPVVRAVGQWLFYAAAQTLRASCGPGCTIAMTLVVAALAADSIEDVLAEVVLAPVRIVMAIARLDLPSLADLAVVAAVVFPAKLSPVLNVLPAVHELAPRRDPRHAQLRTATCHLSPPSATRCCSPIRRRCLRKRRAAPAPTRQRGCRDAAPRRARPGISDGRTRPR